MRGPSHRIDQGQSLLEPAAGSALAPRDPTTFRCDRRRRTGTGHARAEVVGSPMSSIRCQLARRGPRRTQPDLQHLDDVGRHTRPRTAWRPRSWPAPRPPASSLSTSATPAAVRSGFPARSPRRRSARRSAPRLPFSASPLPRLAASLTRPRSIPSSPFVFISASSCDSAHSSGCSSGMQADSAASASTSLAQ